MKKSIIYRATQQFCATLPLFKKTDTIFKREDRPPFLITNVIVYKTRFTTLFNVKLDIILLGLLE